MTILVTGGAGFIGSNFIHQCLNQNDELVINLDNLSYAGNLRNLATIEKKSNYLFIKEDIGHYQNILTILSEYQVRAIVHFAAESHVDRSISSPNIFIKTNIVGTFNLIEAARTYWNSLSGSEKTNFRFIHVSTDEVYGTLDLTEAPFTEQSRYQPNSPYSASKASSDHIVRSYFHTYEFPVITTNCSNNYGPFQFPEKLIPLCIERCLHKKTIPVYGDGKQIRDWLYVHDHCLAIKTVLNFGKVGEVYNIGSNNEKTNLEIVHAICHEFNRLNLDGTATNYLDLIEHVKDRPGHDRRYAIDFSKIKKELSWEPQTSFESGMRNTINWYIQNKDWIETTLADKAQSCLI